MSEWERDKEQNGTESWEERENKTERILPCTIKLAKIELLL